jgi:hypothetical protein
MAKEDQRGDIISKARVAVIKNFFELTKVFTQSLFDTVLLKQIKSMKLFGKYDKENAINEGIKALANEDRNNRFFHLNK